MWTEREQELRTLRADGVAFSKIADLFGTTRGAVAGACSRLGIGQPHDRAPQLLGGFTARIRHNKPKPAAPEVIEVGDTGPFFSLMAVPKDRCRWPVDGVGAGLFVCGAPAEPKRPYCPPHCCRAYNKVAR